MKKFFILSLAAALAACTVGPDFKTPAPPSAASAYMPEAEALPADQRVALGKQIEAEWWTLFASDPLNSVIHQAVADNYSLAASRETLRQAEEAVKAESGAFWPQVSLNATATRQKYGVALFGPSNFSIPPFTAYEIGPSASFTPDLFGGTRRSVERARALAEYQAHELDAAYVTLTGSVVAQAIEIASAKAEAEAVQRIVAEDEKTLQLAHASFTAGGGTKTDILAAQSRLDNDKALLPPLQQRLSLARHALAVLVGKAPAEWSPPEFVMSSFTLPQELPVALPSELVRKRPDILAAEANLHAASAAIGIATANLYPKITLTANSMQEALSPAGLLREANNAFALAANLTAPLFNGGKLTAEKRAAEHAYQAALAQYKETILHAFAQVADALAALTHDGEAAAAAQQAVTTTTASLDLARKSYRAGNTGLLPIGEAQRQLASAELALTGAQRQRLIDTAQLFVALGGSPVASALKP